MKKINQCMKIVENYILNKLLLLRFVGDLLAIMSQQVNEIKKRVWVTRYYELDLIESGRQD